MRACKGRLVAPLRQPQRVAGMKTAFFQAEGPEGRRRRREVFLIFVILLVLAGLAVAESRLSRGQGDVPLGQSVLFFATINLNIVLILLLIFLILRNLVKLVLERHRRVLGAKLRTKLVAAFVLLSILPTGLLFYVSWFFISRSIEMWVEGQMERALEGSLSVARSYYKGLAEDTLYYAAQVAHEIRREGLLDPSRSAGLQEFLRLKLLAFRMDRMALLDGTLREIMVVSASDRPRRYEPPEPERVAEVLEGKEASRIRTTASGEVVEVMVPVRREEGSGPETIAPTVLVAWRLVPESLVGTMAQITDSLEHRQKLTLYQRPLKSVMFMALILVTLLIVFGASWFGFYLAKEITVPLQHLAGGIQEVAAGNLDHRIEPAGDDEFGVLVDSYNRMIEDLRKKNREVQETQDRLRETNVELEERRRYVETLLRSVGAGVVSLGRDLRIRTVNRFCETLFGVTADTVLGKPYETLFQGDAMRPIRDLVEEVGRNRWKGMERRFWVPVGEEVRNLSIRASSLSDEQGQWIGVVLVIEDDTELFRAQRAAAWREVARRIAHEIKNPLTPIQLSAQRLQKKYASRFGEDGRVFEECTNTIIRQVEEMKNLVNEFSSFARMPAAKPTLTDLNAIVREVLTLFEQAHRSVTFRFDEDPGLPRLLLDPDQIRRVLVNLLDNAVDATGRMGRVEVASRYDSFLHMGVLEVADDGSGIPRELRGKLFEPYTSGKKGGTGLGLAIVKSIVSDHNGYIRVRDNQPRGTRFVLEFPVPSA